jgi:hypothetical protein
MMNNFWWSNNGTDRAKTDWILGSSTFVDFDKRILIFCGYGAFWHVSEFIEYLFVISKKVWPGNYGTIKYIYGNIEKKI